MIKPMLTSVPFPKWEAPFGQLLMELLLFKVRLPRSCSWIIKTHPHANKKQVSILSWWPMSH